MIVSLRLEPSVYDFIPWVGALCKRMLSLRLELSAYDCISRVGAGGIGHVWVAEPGGCTLLRRARNNDSTVSVNVTQNETLT